MIDEADPILAQVPRPTRRKRSRWTVIVAATLVGLIVGIVAANLRHRESTVTWRTGQAMSTPVQIAAQTPDGRGYSISTDGPWIDESGSYHENGRPKCLQDFGHFDRVRFATVDVVNGSFSWRQVVEVDCRP